ncbi:MAG TPA: hypothetical protein PKD63_04890 [Solirubrobacteraceae bacterium]|nr:hypothetical protein [Solirubrobacteraceae bacterium]
MPRRSLTPTALSLLALLAAPAGASAADLYAGPAGGSGPPCASAAAPCTLADAVLAARATAGGDVVHLAAGAYAEPLRAVGAADTGLTFAGAGVGVTTLAAAPAGDAPVVELGAGAGTMSLRDLTIDGTGAGMTAAALRSRLDALSLLRVRVVQTGTTPKQAPAIDADTSAQALTLDAVDVLSDTQTGDAAMGAVNAGGPAVVRDSVITHTATGDSAALYARGPLTVLRSRLTHGQADAGHALRLSNQAEALAIVIDSTVLGGGRTAARFDLGIAASTVALRGDTLAPFPASTGFALDVRSNVAASLTTATVDSTLLVGRSARAFNGPVVTCTFSNVPTGASAVACPATPGNVVGNTRLTPAELQLGADLAPLPGSPAIDTGNTSGLAPGESATDVLGRPRAASSDDRCDAGPGRRDKGAFERYRSSPQIGIDGPPEALPGAPATFSAVTAAPGLELTWSFSDGAGGGTASTTTHAFAALPGSVSLTARDPRWNCSSTVSRAIAAAPVPAAGDPATPAAKAAKAPDRSAPRLTAAKLRSARVRLPRGSLGIGFRLSEAATVSVTIGRVSGKRIVAPRRVSVRGRAGANTVALTARRLKLRRGSYAVQLRARDAAGNAARVRTLRFSVR